MSKVGTAPQIEAPKPPKAPESFRGFQRSTIKVLKPHAFDPIQAIRLQREE